MIHGSSAVLRDDSGCGQRLTGARIAERDLAERSERCEWDRLAPLIPAAKPGGRPRKTDMRSAMNAIFFLLRTGCPWRYSPAEIFPPRSTVYNIFRAFQRQGVWEAIWEACARPCANGWAGASPSAASSIAARSGRPKRGMRERRSRRSGYVAGKKVKGRRSTLSSIPRLPLRVVVHPPPFRTGTARPGV